jgi:hypothetical protein
MQYNSKKLKATWIGELERDFNNMHGSKKHYVGDPTLDPSMFKYSIGDILHLNEWSSGRQAHLLIENVSFIDGYVTDWYYSFRELETGDLIDREVAVVDKHKNLTKVA